MCLCVFFAVDIISAIEFDKTGDHLATGDRGGRVVLFERTDTKEVCFYFEDFMRTFFRKSKRGKIFNLTDSLANYLCSMLEIEEI